MKRTLWTERKFTFDFPEGWLSNIIERLHGTVPRMREMVSQLTDEQAGRQFGGKWSIKQNIGHLIDLEDLHEGRIDDFLARKPVLRAADMSNKKTHETDHNGRTVESLINEFTKKRVVFISRLEKLDDEILKSKAMHPRLQVPMRPCDVAYFTAEHDDHHMADIRVIFNEFKNK